MGIYHISLIILLNIETILGDILYYMLSSVYLYSV